MMPKKKINPAEPEPSILKMSSFIFRSLEIFINMPITGIAGLFLFFGIVTAFRQSLQIQGALDVPAMLTNRESDMIATSTVNALPLAKLAMMLYLVVIILFLTTLATDLSLILAIIYHDFLREMFQDFGQKSKEEIIEMGRVDRRSCALSPHGKQESCTGSTLFIIMSLDM